MCFTLGCVRALRCSLFSSLEPVSDPVETDRLLLVLCRQPPGHLMHVRQAVVAGSFILGFIAAGALLQQSQAKVLPYAVEVCKATLC